MQIQIHSLIERQIDRQTDRQTPRQADTQTDRQIERQIDSRIDEVRQTQFPIDWSTEIPGTQEKLKVLNT